MNDHDLNKAMAVKVCGYPLLAEDSEYEDLHIIADENEEDGYTFQCAEYEEPWNPLHNWNQAMECVVRALLSRDGIDFILSGGGHGNHSYTVCFYGLAIQGHEHQDEAITCTASRFELLPRAICEAAFEAWEKLKETT